MNVQTLSPSIDKIQTAIQEQIHLDLVNKVLPSSAFYIYTSPILLLLVGALAVMMVGVFTRIPATRPNRYAWYLSVVVCFLASLLSVTLPVATNSVSFLNKACLIDGIACLSFSVISIGTLFTLLLASTTSVGQRLFRAEFLALLLFSSAGLMVMCCAGEFSSFFVGLEMTSLSLYVLVGYQRPDLRATEAAIKYFLMGAVGAAVLLMGIACFYASTGSLNIADLALLPAASPLGVLSLLLITCGLAFKLGLFPFHCWTPDVYQGASAHLTGYMSALVKYAVAMVFLRILTALPVQGNHDKLAMVFWILGVGSLIVGALYGLVHTSIKRLLAYSSIANAGYFCLAFAALARNPASVMAKQSLVSYALIYAVLSMGSFAVLSWFEEGNKEDLLREELAGIGSKKPFAACALTVFLFGLAGIPPVAGFFGKFFLVFASFHEGIVGLPIILIVCSIISLAYYLSITVEMWFKHPTRYSMSSAQSAQTNLALATLTGIAVIGFLGSP